MTFSEHLHGMIMAIPDELQDTYPVVVPKHNFARFSRNQLAYWHDKGKIKTLAVVSTRGEG